MQKTRRFGALLRVVALLAVGPMVAGAQQAPPAEDVATRLRAVLPSDVAERVLARIAEARSRELPAQALENRALGFASRGVAPADIERAIGEAATRMEQVQQTLERALGQRPNPEEVDAGAEAMRQGVDGAAVSALASSAPSGRSLAVPLFVIGSLVERGLPSDQALAQVQERLRNRASDAELEGLAGAGRRPEGVGPGMRPVDRPTNVPATGGRPTVPTQPPVTPPTTTTPRRP